MSGKARRFFIPRSRRLTMDVLHFHRKVPICPHDRLCDLSELIAARKQAAVRISWSVLFIKAYALMAERLPEFRQCYLNFPFLHGYQHSSSVGMMALEREFEGERWLFWGKFPKPETTSLGYLQHRLNHYKNLPVKEKFRNQIQLSYLPTILRRFFWWTNLNCSGKLRAQHAGTFFLTTLAGKQTEIQNPPAFHTGNFTYGPFDEQGRSRLTLAYDHRLMDGSLVADALQELESILNTEILQELAGLTPADVPELTGAESTANQRAA